jgi:hypothetical protein
MKSLTEEQLRKMLIKTYYLGTEHATAMAEETIAGRCTPSSRLKRAQEIQQTLDDLIKSC